MRELDLLNKENFVTAYFTDVERKHVEVVWKDSGDSLTASSVSIEEVDKDGNPHPLVEHLFSIITLDELHDLTYRKKRDEEEAFLDVAVQIARRKGLIIDPIAYASPDVNGSEEEKVDTKFYTYGLKLFFGMEFDENAQKEDLFIVKLAAFELDIVRLCKDKGLKAELRRAKNPTEVLDTLIKIKKHRFYNYVHVLLVLRL